MHLCFKSQLEDLKQFVIILLIFIIAFGIALQAVSFPGPGQYSKSWSEVIRGILDLPYWQMYGELFLEEISGKSDFKNTLLDHFLFDLTHVYLYHHPQFSAA